MKALILALMSLMAFSEASPFFYKKRNPCDYICSYAYAQCKTYPYGKNHPIYPPHHPNYDASEEDDDAVDDPSPFYHNAYKPSLYFPCKSPKCFIQCSNGKPVAQKTAPGTLWCQTKKTSGKLIHKDTYNSHHCLNLKSYHPRSSHHPHYPPSHPQYPPHGSHYPKLGSHYPPHGSHYPKHGSHYPKHGSHYPKHGSHYPPHGSHYPPHGSHYPPHGSHYPKHGSHYPKHGSHYPKHGSHYPPHGSHYPPHRSHNSHDY